MNEPIEELYFNWLCAKVIPAHSDNYHGLLAVMHRTEFVWIPPVIGDRNRASDGVNLRLLFLNSSNYFCDRNWVEQPCSVLEALIAFAGKANFQTDVAVADWFWVFVQNLRLDDFRRISDGDIPAITSILNRFVYRQYRRNGDGGLFPLRSPQHDQREVEIWYQFCEYLVEQGLM